MEPEKMIMEPQLEEKVRLGISACLLGECVRYDGGHKLETLLTEALPEILRDRVEWVPFCPETGFGLAVPRPPIQLSGDPDQPRAVEVESGTPVEGFEEYCRTLAEELAERPLAGFVFKKKSPSCGLCVRVYDAAGEITGMAPGVFAAACRRRFPALPCVEEEDLREPEVLGAFLNSVGLA